MALFSFRHSVKTYSDRRLAENRVAKSGQTAAHLRYITRQAAARSLVRARLSAESVSEIGRNAEENARKRRGRVCERFIVALPLEASEAERERLVVAFAEGLTQGQAGYVAAIHDRQGNDQDNPHFHLVAFDTFRKSAGRGRPASVLGMARKGAIERVADLWADLHNQMMREWGYGQELMITSRSFADQGIERIPTIHEGPGSRSMSALGRRLERKEKWRSVDAGRTRAEANHLINQINKMREDTNEKRDRLGRTDDQNGAGSNQCLNAEREGGGGGGEGIGGTAPPFARTSRFSEAPTGTFRPAFRRRGNSQQTFPGRSDQKGFEPWVGRGHCGVGSTRMRGIRRIYLELIMLRDTLRARAMKIRKERGDGGCAARSGAFREERKSLSSSNFQDQR